MDENSRSFDKDKIIDKMRELRDRRDLQFLNQAIEETGDNNVEVQDKVQDVKYLGRITLERTNEQGEIEPYEEDIYLMIEEIDGKVLYKYYNENMDCLAIDDDRFGIVLEEGDLNQKNLKEKLEDLSKDGELDLNELEEERIEEIAKQLGVTPEQLKKVSELDLDEDIEEQIERAQDEEKTLTEKETEKIISGKQELKLDSKVDDKRTLGSKIGLDSEKDGKTYRKLVVVDSEDIKSIDPDAKIGNTRYSFVAVDNDNKAKVINDRLEVDAQTGSNAMDESIRADADGTIKKDNQIESRYKIKGSDEYLSVDNAQYGEIKVYYGKGKTKDGDMPIETQLETTNVRPTPIQLRNLQREERGVYRNDEIAKETEECDHEKSFEDVDGDGTTKSQDHIEFIVDEILENPEIDRVFTRNEVRESLEKNISKEGNEKTLEQIKAETEQELDRDAGQFQVRDQH